MRIRCRAEYFNDFAHVELLADEQSVIARVGSRDDIVGILPDENGYYLLTQGNEPDSVVEYAKLVERIV